MNSATININGQTQDIMIGQERQFSSGSKGFYGGGKIVIDGKKYQVGLNIIEIGSKPKET